MKSYRSAISWAVHDSMNMPDPERYPTKFIEWGEDICGLIAEIYECAFEDVVEDFHKALEITEE